MSVPDAFPEMDDTDLLGLFLDEDHGSHDAFFDEGNLYIEDWLFGQDVSIMLFNIPLSGQEGGKTISLTLWKLVCV